MHRPARSSIIALALVTAVTLVAPQIALASSSSSQDDNWNQSPASKFDWSTDPVDLNTESRYGHLSLSEQVSLLFFAIDSAWSHAGGDREALNELWTSSWKRIEDHDDDDHRSRAKFFDDDRWRHGFDEWAHHHRTEVCPPPDGSESPTIPEPLFYGAMMGTGIGAVALLRGWRHRGRSSRPTIAA